MGVLVRTAGSLAVMAALFAGSARADGMTVPRDEWFAAMQATDVTAAVALYQAGDAPEKRATADRASIRGHDVTFGRVIHVNDRETRLQIRTDDATTLLLTWAQTDAGWRVSKTEQLAPLLFLQAAGIERRPSPWPEHAKPSPPHAMLRELIRVHRQRPPEVAAAFLRDSTAQSLRPTSVAAFVGAFADNSEHARLVFEESVGDRGWRGRISIGEHSFRVDCEGSGTSWKIVEIVEVTRAPEAPKERATMALIDGQQIARSLAAFQLATGATAKPKALIDCGIDGDGAQPVGFTSERAQACLEAWRKELGAIRIQSKLAPQDLVGAPISETFMVPFEADRFGGSVLLRRFSVGWRVLGLRSSAPVETERFYPEDMLVPK